VKSLLRPVFLLVGVGLAGCAGVPSEALGPAGATLRPCPASPNCVHTGDGVPEGTERFLAGPGREVSWSQVMETVEELPRTSVVTVRSGYLHAESRSRIFRFVDDLEVLLIPEEGELVVRSASRLGRSDLGVNAARVEALREALTGAGVLGGG